MYISHKNKGGSSVLRMLIAGFVLWAREWCHDSWQIIFRFQFRFCSFTVLDAV